MWNDLVFDKAGNLYVPDDKPRIWRVSPDGTASIWFTDPRLTGFFGFAGGPLGGRIDPTGQWLYFSITVSAEFPLASRSSTGSGWSTIRRPSDLELVHASRSTRPRRAAPGDRPRLRQVGQPLRQPARPQPDRRPRPRRRRDRADLRPAVPLAVGPRVRRQVAARDERRPRTGRQPRRLEDLQGLRRRDGPAAQPTEDYRQLTSAARPTDQGGPGSHVAADRPNRGASAGTYEVNGVVRGPRSPRPGRPREEVDHGVPFAFAQHPGSRRCARHHPRARAVGDGPGRPGLVSSSSTRSPTRPPSPSALNRMSPTSSGASRRPRPSPATSRRPAPAFRSPAPEPSTIEWTSRTVATASGSQHGTSPSGCRATASRPRGKSPASRAPSTRPTGLCSSRSSSTRSRTTYRDLNGNGQPDQGELSVSFERFFFTCR